LVSIEQGKGYDGKELWSIECLVDELFLCLAKKRETVTGCNGKTIRVRTYYHQAMGLMKYIPITRPVPEFVIIESDLSPKVIEELEARIEYPDILIDILK
jgi:hypothetical protein